MGLKLKVVHARTVDVAILELIEKENFDLLVMGAVVSPSGTSKGYGAVAERVLKSSTCPVWVSCISL